MEEGFWDHWVREGPLETAEPSKKGKRERGARDSRFSDKVSAPRVVRLPPGGGASVSQSARLAEQRGLQNDAVGGDPL
jgi:hypothetical protein